MLIAIAGLLAAQLAAMRMNAFVKPKVENARYARQALGVLIEDAVRAILIGCSFYIIRYAYLRLTGKLTPAWLDPVPAVEQETGVTRQP